MKALQRVLNICMVAFLFIPALLPQHDMRAQETEQIILDYAFGIPEVEAGFQQPYKLVKIPELDIYSIPGKPVLPFKTARILIPYGEEIEDIQVIPGDRNYLGRFYIQPGQEAIPIDGEETGPTPPDTSIYNSARPYPAKPFSEVGVQWKRGFQILILNLYPLEYIPKFMEVSWFESFEVTINTKQAEISEGGLYRGVTRDKELICDVVDNPEQLSTYPLQEPCLAIAPKPQPTPTPELAPGVKGPVAVETPVLPEPASAPQLSLQADLDIRLSVPSFNQRNPDWADEVMQTCGLTIGEGGCALTSAAMVFQYYNADKNPGELNTCMGNNACPFDWEYASNHCSEGKVLKSRKASFIGCYNFSYSTLVGALENGYPPILKLTKPDGRQHWVVVNAVHGDGLSPDDYEIDDPWDGNNKGLASYTDNGWSLSDIALFSATPCDYLIITNEELKNASEPNFQTLADWKESRGIKTTIVTVEDIYSNYSGEDNQEKIRNFIRDVYVSNGIEYVLLGGDADGGDVGGESGDNIVPVRGLWAWDYDMDPPNIPSDLYYACLDGNYDYDGDGIYGEPNDGPDGGEVDLMAEVYVGRAPVDSAEELSNFVTKTISYEQSAGDPYLKEVWMVGELLWEEGGCAAEEAVNRSDVTNPEGVLNSVRRFRDVAFNEECVRLYYEYSPDVKRILIQEPKLLAELARLVVKHTPAIRYVAGDKGGKDIKLTETDIDGVISFVEKFKEEVKGREEKIGAPRVARMVALIEEFEEEANESEGKNFSEAFRSSIYSGMGGNARLEGETWGADYKDEIKDGSCNCGYCTEGFRDVYDAHTLYDRDYEGHDWPKSEVINIVNGNVHLINHLGHSNVNYVMKMNNDDADALTNSKYFFGYSQGCYAGSFDNRDAPSPYGYGDYLSYDCIAEHLVTNPTGAFAFIANSRFGWGQKKSTNGPSQYYDRQFWDAIFNERIANLGKANQDSKEDNIGHISSGVMRFCYYEINLLGDPETPLFDLRPQYEHDIAITEMHVPHKTEPGVSRVVQATVTNVGKNDESNVQIQLLEEDAVKDTTIIGILPSGSSRDVQFIWVGDIEGAYKLKVYAVPVNGEEYTDNNYQEDIIKVGRVILVDDDGEQCPVADFMSIQEAIQGASDGDILRVYPGTYRNFVVNKQIDLTGVGMPLVDGQREGNVIEIQADNVTLQGFRIINSGNDDNAGVLVESSHSVVTNNTVTSNQCGIGLNAASNNTISDNNVSRGEYGIFLESSCSNNDISRNMISSNDNGIYGYDSASAALSSPPPVLPNRISSNTLNNNHQSGYDDMGGNEWSENYWDDYVGEDVDGDGIGDTPYEIPGTAGAKDGHPLIEPISPFTIFLPCVLKGYRS